MSQIKKTLSGTEEDVERKWNQALQLISQFSLPDDCKNPERFIHRLLSDESRTPCELVDLAREIRHVDDTHSFINDIVLRIGENYDVVINDILTIVSKAPEWEGYTHNIRAWLQARADL